ncbi:MAG: PRC-barrel domain-containing protein, partial [Acidobacteriota bacterium]|nr:PRC-barrel domain-containing protein [Acidobacteriota bacterium]
MEGFCFGGARRGLRPAAPLVLSSPRRNFPNGETLMLYLSQLLGRPVREVEGDPVATIKDVIVR